MPPADFTADLAENLAVKMVSARHPGFAGVRLAVDECCLQDASGSCLDTWIRSFLGKLSPGMQV